MYMDLNNLSVFVPLCELYLNCRQLLAKEIHGTELTNERLIYACMHTKASLSWKISRKISRFQERFWDFKKDFGISRKISGFQGRFQDFEDFWISRRFRDFGGEVYEISRSGGPLESILY